jgi:hypothetical protein
MLGFFHYLFFSKQKIVLFLSFFLSITIYWLQVTTFLTLA